MLSGVKVLRQQSSSRENLHHHNRINHLVQCSAASSIPQRLQTPSGGHHSELVPTSTSALPRGIQLFHLPSAWV